ncbi:unnamed protein product [Phytophthora fragariaefolia]|uniref:Unnamed protein product n=1 Tax=Phytophthora fragariaefolia TaxID=1490495 RepID=A0A9W7CVE8_9STRA|nr:unnamed protein product [Phytophthora fragariaefolia]
MLMFLNPSERAYFAPTTRIEPCHGNPGWTKWRCYGQQLQVSDPHDSLGPTEQQNVLALGNGSCCSNAGTIKEYGPGDKKPHPLNDFKQNPSPTCACLSSHQAFHHGRFGQQSHTQSPSWFRPPKLRRYIEVTELPAEHSQHWLLGVAPLELLNVPDDRHLVHPLPSSTCIPQVHVLP